MEQSAQVTDRRPWVHRAAGPGHAHQQALSDATALLVLEDDSPAGDVFAAVARARSRVLTAYLACSLFPPPADEYVTLVVGLARQDLHRPEGSLSRQG